MRFKRKVSLFCFSFATLLLFYLISNDPGQDDPYDNRKNRQQVRLQQDQRRLHHQETDDNSPFQSHNQPHLPLPHENSDLSQLHVKPIIDIPQSISVKNGERERRPPPAVPAVSNYVDRKQNIGVPQDVKPQRDQRLDALNQAPKSPYDQQQANQQHVLPGKKPDQQPKFHVGKPSLIFDSSELRGPAVENSVNRNVPLQVNNVGGSVGELKQVPPSQKVHNAPQQWQDQQNVARLQIGNQGKQAPLEQSRLNVLSHNRINFQGPREMKQVPPAFKNGIHLSVVACGDRANETLIMLKSAVLFTRAPLHFHIFAEDELHSIFRNRLELWPSKYRAKIKYDIYSITFPPGENAMEWKKLFKPCASQRLFLPDVLTDVDSILYVDTDVLFLFPLDEIWEFFNKFNATHVAAMTPEHETKSIGWYNRFAQHPYYGETGVNSGVMLMNLTRIRKFDWTKKIVPYYRQYKLKITWGDQDLLNILFHYHPELLYVYPCEWNYRPDHCMYSSLCKRAEQNGIKVVHGNRGVFHNEKQITFKAVYDALVQYQLGEDLKNHLIDPLTNGLMATKSTQCGKLYHAFLKTILKSILDIS